MANDPMLVDISNAFFTGNYQQCISLSEKIKVWRNLLNFLVNFQLIILILILETVSRARCLHVSLIFGHQSLSCRHG